MISREIFKKQIFFVNWIAPNWLFNMIAKISADVICHVCESEPTGGFLKVLVKVNVSCQIKAFS